MKQSRLALPVAQATTLVSVDTARAALGLDAESVTALCESGLLVAFDLSTGCSTRREIRIWADSIRGHVDGIHVAADPHDEIEAIIGHTAAEWIACTQLAQRFCVHRRSVYRWREDGDLDGHLVGHVMQVRRSSIVPFLSHRRIR